MEDRYVNRLGPGDEPPKGAGKGNAKNDETPRIAHTLAACCRCRQRKTRCDTGLPRCGPCARTNSRCEFYDPTQHKIISRGYVVELQHKVKALEEELAMAKTGELEDPEFMMRSAAAVRIHKNDDTRFLGPSSGIAMTRLVIKLAKECTGARSVSEIVSDTKARQIKARFEIEGSKPTSKVYPLTSNIAADGLPSDRGLVNRLVQLFHLRVQPMYPMLHEPSFQQDLEDVYAGSKDEYKQFVVRIVIAISLQKVDAQYAGLADSYYLAALQFLEPVIRRNDVKTLQCYCLIGEYSLVTPTRTAVYYIIGLAVRLMQSLGFHDERSIKQLPDGSPADSLEVDLRRRLFWITWNMDLGLAHSLGRPSAMATKLEHIDVDFYSVADDKYITPGGITPGKGVPALRKWISLHFLKMRLLQLEIRRKLYRKTQDEPKDDRHPWFREMETKLIDWRDMTPEGDTGMGFDKLWFVARYNTMVVMLYRPTPQVPRPSAEAAKKCFEACEFNIYLQRKQIDGKIVEVTWIFSQTILMAINTILWSLSYAEIRRSHSKKKVKELLNISLDAISLASDRWPGIASALELYLSLIDACLRVYDTGENDLPVVASSPEQSASPESIQSQYRSRTESPATLSTASFVTTPDAATAFQQGYTPQSHVEPSRSSPYDPQMILQDLNNPFAFGAAPQLPPLLSNPTTSSTPHLPSAFSMSATSAGIHMLEPYDHRTAPAPMPYSPLAPADDQFYRPVLEPDPMSPFKTGLSPSFPSSAPWDRPVRSPVDNFRSSKYQPGGCPLSPCSYDVKGETHSDQYMFSPESFYLPPDTYGLDQAQHSKLLRELETTGASDLDRKIQEGWAVFHPPEVSRPP